MKMALQLGYSICLTFIINLLIFVACDKTYICLAYLLAYLSTLHFHAPFCDS